MAERTDTEATNEQTMAAALAPFGWTCSREFWQRYHQDPWVFNLANAVERLSRTETGQIDTHKAFVRRINDLVNNAHRLTRESLAYGMTLALSDLADNLAPEDGDACGPCTRGDHEACIAASTDVCRCFDHEHEDDGG